MARPGRDERKRRGGGAAWGPGAASSFSAAPAAQSLALAARGAQSLSPLARVLLRLAEPLGLGAVVSTQAGLAALTLGVATAAAIGTLVFGLSSAGKTSSPATFAASQGPSALSPSGSSLTGSEMPRAGQAGSLDLLSTANPGGSAASPATKQAEDKMQEPDQAQPAVEAASDAPQTPAQSAAKPALIASKGLPKENGFLSAGRLAPMGGLSSGIGQSFQSVYKGSGQGKLTAMRNAPRASYRATGRSAAAAGGRGAMSQLRAANRLSRQAAALPGMSPAAATASAPFDGKNAGTGAGVSQPSAGVGQGGAGVGQDAGSTQAMDQKTTPEPPAPSPKKAENVTPYQGLIYAGIGALAIGMICLLIAGMLISKAQQMLAGGAVAPPVIAAAMQLYSMAKMLAMGAAAAGVASMGVGAVIASKFGQMLQGGMFLAGGGVLTAAAVIVLLSADKASQDAQTQLDKINAVQGGAAHDALASGGAAPPGGSSAPAAAPPAATAPAAPASAPATAPAPAPAAAPATAASSVEDALVKGATDNLIGEGLFKPIGPEMAQTMGKLTPPVGGAPL